MSAPSRPMQTSCNVGGGVGEMDSPLLWPISSLHGQSRLGGGLARGRLLEEERSWGGKARTRARERESETAARDCLYLTTGVQAA